jgi:glycosyltransferase involved in cell wall biosynthesis
MTKLKKRIALIVPSLNAGGMERVMSELSHYFVTKDSLEVHLVLYGKYPDVFYSVPDEVILHKPAFKFNDKIRFISTIARLIYLRKEILKIKPHSILSFGEYWNSFVMLALMGVGTRKYVSDRCSPEKRLGGMHDLLRKFLYRFSSGVIVQTQKAKEIYRTWLPQTSLYVIGNPISLKKFNQIESDHHENIILSVGRLINSKHHDQLIRIFHEIALPNWKLVIVGGDAQKQQNFSRLSRLISELGLKESVLLAGEEKNVLSYYKKSKIFAFTSSSEGFPNVVVEALASGLPVVAYDCIAGPSDLIVSGFNGFLVPLFDSEQFKEKLQLLMEDENLRQKMSQNAPGSVAHLDIDKIGQKFLEIITN